MVGVDARAARPFSETTRPGGPDHPVRDPSLRSTGPCGIWWGARVHSRAFGHARLTSFLALLSVSRVVARRHAVVALSPVSGVLSTLGWVRRGDPGLGRRGHRRRRRRGAAIRGCCCCWCRWGRRSRSWPWRALCAGCRRGGIGVIIEVRSRSRIWGPTRRAKVLVVSCSTNSLSTPTTGTGRWCFASILKTPWRRACTRPGSSCRRFRRRDAGCGWCGLPPLPHTGRVERSRASRRWRACVLLVGAVVAAVLTGLYWAAPVAVLMPVTGVLVVAAGAFDLRWRRVPNLLTGGAAAIVLVLVVLVELAFDESMVSSAAAGAAIVATPLLVSHLITRARTPGLGDVKLAAVLGAACGAAHPSTAYLALVLALLIGIPFGLVWRASGRGRAFPFAPSLGAAAVVVLATWRLMDGSTSW